MTTDELHHLGDYTALMLQIDPAIMTGYPRLHLRGMRAPAWIDHKSWHLQGIGWQLWVERNGRMTSAKCPLRLYGPLEPFFDKSWRPSEIELAG